MDYKLQLILLSALYFINFSHTRPVVRESRLVDFDDELNELLGNRFLIPSDQQQDNEKRGVPLGESNCKRICVRPDWDTLECYKYKMVEC